MARKKIEPITSLGNEDKLTVQKSLPLFALWRSELTLAEFKILDTYLSRIDSHKPEKRAVIFEKGELENILEVTKISKQNLKIRLKHLMGNVVEIPDDSTENGFMLVTLFDEAVAEQDEFGLWQVKLECSQNAMKYFFNIENLGYLRYKLRCITSLKSRYTYIMFIYLEANRYRKSWDVSLDELKQILNCGDEEYAKEFKYFNRDVLKKVQEEMLEKTECRYTYSPIKKGRFVAAIHFEVELLSMVSLEEVGENQQTVGQCSGDNSEGDEREIELWQEPLEKFNFSREEYDELFSVLATVSEPMLPHVMDNIDINRYHYIAQKVATLENQNTKKPIKNKYAYLLKMIKKDANDYDEECLG